MSALTPRYYKQIAQLPFPIHNT